MFHDPIAVEKFKQLVDEYLIKTLIETGTDQGHGALAASQFVPFVHTIDNDLKRLEGARELWDTTKPTPCILDWYGSSPEVLKKLLRHQHLSQRVCFYLDAHGGQYWPLLDELDVISRFGPGDCVIIIHDFKVPGKPWGFDSYNGQDLDLDYVLPSLNKINPQFKLVYNQEAEGNKRGILYALP